MASATILQQRLTALGSDPQSVYGELATVDHKIGKRWIATAIVFLIIGGVEALVMRAQLLGPNLEDGLDHGRGDRNGTPAGPVPLRGSRGERVRSVVLRRRGAGRRRARRDVMGSHVARRELRRRPYLRRGRRPSLHIHPLCASTWRNGERIGGAPPAGPYPHGPTGMSADSKG